MNEEQLKNRIEKITERLVEAKENGRDAQIKRLEERLADVKGELGELLNKIDPQYMVVEDDIDVEDADDVMPPYDDEDELEDDEEAEDVLDDEDVSEADEDVEEDNKDADDEEAPKGWFNQ